MSKKQVDPPAPEPTNPVAPNDLEAKILQCAKECGLTHDELKGGMAADGSDVAKWLTFFANILPFIKDLFGRQVAPPTP